MLRGNSTLPRTQKRMRSHISCCRSLDFSVYKNISNFCLYFLCKSTILGYIVIHSCPFKELIHSVYIVFLSWGGGGKIYALSQLCMQFDMLSILIAIYLSVSMSERSVYKSVSLLPLRYDVEANKDINMLDNENVTQLTSMSCFEH